MSDKEKHPSNPEFEPETKITHVTCVVCDHAWELGDGIDQAEIEVHEFDDEPGFTYMQLHCPQGHNYRVFNIYDEHVQYLEDGGVEIYGHEIVPLDIVSGYQEATHTKYRPASKMIIQECLEFADTMDEIDTLADVQKRMGWEVT